MGVKDEAVAGKMVSSGQSQKGGNGMMQASSFMMKGMDKATGVPRKGGTNNIMDVAAHDTSKNGANTSKGGM